MPISPADDAAVRVRRVHPATTATRSGARRRPAGPPATRSDRLRPLARSVVDHHSGRGLQPSARRSPPLTARGIADALTAVRPLLEPPLRRRTPRAERRAPPRDLGRHRTARPGAPRDRRHASTQEEYGMPHTLTTCTFCGVGCGIYLESAGNRVAGAYPSMSHPTNEGRICVRGWHVHEVASSPDRLSSPLLRKNGEFQEVSWDEALGFVAGRLRQIRAARPGRPRLPQLAALLERGELPAAEAGPGRHRHQQRGPRHRGLLQQLHQRPARHARRAGHHQLHRRAGHERGDRRGRRGPGAAAADHRRAGSSGPSCRGAS